MKTKIKKAFHILLALMLACILFNDCAVSSRAYAADIGSDTLNALSRYLNDWFGKPLKAATLGGGMAVGYALDHPTITAGETYTTVLPAYQFVGKVRYTYSPAVNGISSELITCYVNFCGDNNTSDWYPDWSDQYFDNVFLNPNEMLYVRQFSNGDIQNIRVRYLRFPSFSNAGTSLRIYQNGISVAYWTSTGVPGSGEETYGGTISTYSGGQINFMTNTVNKIDIPRTSIFSAENLIKGDYSMNQFYCSYASTNDASLYNSVQTYVTNNNYNVNYPGAMYPFKLLRLVAGTKITNNNVNYYNDYGITFDNDTNTFNFDYSTYNTYVESTDGSDFLELFNQVYSFQPELNANFNGNNYIDYTDILPPVVELDPDEPGGVSIPPAWLEPYPPLILDNNLDFELSPVPTNTIPADTLSNMGRLAGMGWNFYDALGLASPIIAIAVLSVLIKKIT